jgi:hypothetical protein
VRERRRGRPKDSKNKHPWSTDKKLTKAVERYLQPRNCYERQTVRQWRYRLNTAILAKLVEVRRARGADVSQEIASLRKIVAATDAIIVNVRNRTCGSL